MTEGSKVGKHSSKLSQESITSFLERGVCSTNLYVKSCLEECSFFLGLSLPSPIWSHQHAISGSLRANSHAGTKVSSERQETKVSSAEARNGEVKPMLKSVLQIRRPRDTSGADPDQFVPCPGTDGEETETS